ncbi:UNVERIFIED_CONTAM: hypothetical protein NCL1_08226 [Trichonephila clavipes]
MDSIQEPLHGEWEFMLSIEVKVDKEENRIRLQHQETQRNVSSSEQAEDERGPIPATAVKDLFKKWDAVRAMVLEWHPNQADVSRVEDLYNDNAI